MEPRQACLDCLAQEPPALFEAALWIAAEHLPAYPPGQSQRTLDELARQIGASLDDRASASERAQGLLRRMSEQGFCEDDDFPCSHARPCSRWCCNAARGSRCRWRWWPWNWRAGWRFRWSG